MSPKTIFALCAMHARMHAPVSSQGGRQHEGASSSSHNAAVAGSPASTCQRPGRRAGLLEAERLRVSALARVPAAGRRTCKSNTMSTRCWGRGALAQRSW